MIFQAPCALAHLPCLVTLSEGVMLPYKVTARAQSFHCRGVAKKIIIDVHRIQHERAKRSRYGWVYSERACRLFRNTMLGGDELHDKIGCDVMGWYRYRYRYRHTDQA